MVFNLLFSSVGYGFYIHECKLTQKKSFSIETPSLCCTKKTHENQQQNFTKFNCCSIKKELKNGVVSLDFSKEITPKFLVFIEQSTPFVFIPSFFIETLSTQNFDANAPPFAFQNFQILYQSFLI